MVSMLPATLVLTAFIAAYAVSAGTSLKQDQAILPGGNITTGNGCTLIYGGDGNLQLFFNRGNYQRTLWTAGVSANPGKLVMQNDGNLVAYSAEGKPYWNSATSKSSDAPFRLDLQDDCNLVLYNSADRPLWNTATGIVRRTMFEQVRFNRGDILVSEEAPSCWMTFERNKKDENILSMSSGKRLVWTIGGGSQANVMDGVNYVYLTGTGKIMGEEKGFFFLQADWRGLGVEDQGVAPYQVVLAAPCTMEIRGADGEVAFSKAS